MHTYLELYHIKMRKCFTAKYKIVRLLLTLLVTAFPLIELVDLYHVSTISIEKIICSLL